MQPLRRAFRAQAASCAALGSPFMAHLCALLAERLTPGTPLTDRLFGWPGDPRTAADALPLRLCGALHALARAGDPGLTAVYPPHHPGDSALWSAVDTALQTHAATIGRFIDLPPQTNEVRRAAVLIAAAGWLARRHPLPLVLSELGASAGLNLTFDAYALAVGGARIGPAAPVLTLTPDWQGCVPSGPLPPVAGRRGCDISPLDRLDDRDRLMAYLWPDQPHRADLTVRALTLPAPPLDRQDAGDWLQARLAQPRPGHLHMVYHTIAWQYFPPATAARAGAALAAAGARATPDAPLAWFGMEGDGGEGAALTLRLWPGNLTFVMGRADFHGRWVRWTPPA